VIFRKPYAFLIKNFMFIHVILLVLNVYLVLKTTELLIFFNELVVNPTFIVNYDMSSLVLNIFMFIIPIFIIGSSLLVLYLMKLKGKPITLYIYISMVYLVVLSIFYYSYININIIEVQLLDMRVIRANRDLVWGISILQTLAAVFTFIRATGFDVKKFNFASDLNSLDISEEDREEIELSLEVEPAFLVRKIKRRLRNIKYFYKENAFFSNIAIFIVLSILVGYQVINVFYSNRKYNTGELVVANSFNFKVSNAYLTNLDYRGDAILDNRQLLVVEYNFSNIEINNFDLDNLKLYSSNVEVRPALKHEKEVSDLGKLYNPLRPIIEDESYIIIYEVNKDFAKKNNEIILTEGFYRNGNYVYKDYVIKLKEKNIDVNNKNEIIESFKNNFISNGVTSYGSFFLEEVDFKDKFEINYNFCITRDECYLSKEYVVPLVKNENPKGIMKIVIENSNLKDIDFEDALVNNISLEYVKDNTNHVVKSGIRKLSPKNNFNSGTYYFEVDRNLIEADKITMSIKLRVNTYVLEYVKQVSE
jgi:hypothetical protein